MIKGRGLRKVREQNWVHYRKIIAHVLNSFRLPNIRNFFNPVISTQLIDAREVTDTTYTAQGKGVPIYWFLGSKVADDHEDSWDGTWDDETNIRDLAGRIISNPGRSDGGVGGGRCLCSCGSGSAARAFWRR